MDYIIKRRDAESIMRGRNWLLVYGRRKVGKTFLLKELCGFKNYYSVKRDLEILSGSGAIPVSELAREIKAGLEKNNTVVIDEFQRLSSGILEELSLAHPKGRLILSGSSLMVVRKVFEPNSPLLGFFIPQRIGFISPSDILRSLHNKLGAEQLIEFAAFLREPWLIPIFSGESITDFVYKLVTQAKQVISALVGEIFSEEERELTRKYLALLSLIGSGTWKTKELTSIMYSRGLIPEPSPSHIIQYLKNLEEMELVESIRLHRAKGRYYRLFSPVMSIYYYLDSRYDLGARFVSLEEMKPTLQRMINFEIQNFVADLFAEVYGGRKEYFVDAEKEVDFIITKRNKPEIIGEVKWKSANQEDVGKFMKSTERLHGRKVFVCKRSALKDCGAEIINASGLVLLAKRGRG